MKVDRSELKRCVDAFVTSDEGRKLIDDKCMPLWLAMIFSVFMLVLGVILVATLRGLEAGGKLLGSVFTLDLYFGAPGRDFKKRPGETCGLILETIIVGPVENKEHHRYSLLAGSFEDIPRDELQAMAEEFGNYYTGSREPNDEAGDKFVRMLKNDEFTENRRRAVPEPFNRGYEVYLFDLNLNFEELSPLSGRAAAVIATTGPKGSIIQVPWSVIDSAVREDDSDVKVGLFEDDDDVVEGVFEDD